jgi:nitroreductase
MANSMVEFLLTRRSSSRFTDKAPSKADVRTMIEAAMTAPDHGGLKPYRFIAIEGKQRDLFAAAMVSGAAEKKGELPDPVHKKIVAKAFLSPMQIAIIFSPVDNQKIPKWEQFATASCAGFAITLAAHSLGYATIWKSFDSGLGQKLRDLFKMTADEQLLGWINVGARDGVEAEGQRTSDVDAHLVYL